MKLIASLLLAFVSVFSLQAQDKSKFRQMESEWPTPNTYRTGSGAPGHEYWQQKADYQIFVELDEANKTIKGRETITYTNNSPDVLKYLWVQLEQNIWDKDSDAKKIRNNSLNPNQDAAGLKNYEESDYDGGYKNLTVTDRSGKTMNFTINKTMMRIDLPSNLMPGKSIAFNIGWFYNMNNSKQVGGRTGYECFIDNNCIYELAHWFPRMAVYTDWAGWQHKQFLGRGEFTLPFGDYEVQITVPKDHIVASTGELQNASAVLTSTQIQRFAQAKKAEHPIMIVTPSEAKEKEKTVEKATKTWIYKAKNVRDFAWASSRKFIWDACNVEVGGNDVMAMSYYPNEANPLWSQYSTEAVAHTLRVYSKHTIDYPYPVAISVNGPVGGMEYPMISFNGARPQLDGSYSERTKYALISVIIHEVGHNFFPMIINSDERQWTWMDEGLNTFMQYLAEQEWDRDYPSFRGPARFITGYMKGDKAGLEPIMTNSESIKQFGNNAYGKPATGLNILRETIMGRELFDFAFQEYARRWAFKHPNPADFFRTMEDASGVDLDWFWRAWFYTTDYVDISLDDVKSYQTPKLDLKAEMEAQKAEKANEKRDIGYYRNLEKVKKTAVELNPALLDTFNRVDRFAVKPQDLKSFEERKAALNAQDLKKFESGKYYYELNFSDLGGIPMPIIIELNYEDGTSEILRFPAEIWLDSEMKVSKVIATDKAVKQFILDPYQETADVDLSNNSFPRTSNPSRFQLYKPEIPSGRRRN